MLYQAGLNVCMSNLCNVIGLGQDSTKGKYKESGIHGVTV